MSRSCHITFITGMSILLFFILFFSLTSYGEDDRVDFPHDAHLEDLKCTDCHKTATEESTPGFPNEEVCTDCHDGTEGVDLSGLPNRSLYFPTVQFPHDSHSDVECKDCHGDLSEDAPKIIKIDDCMDCHKENDLELDCNGCHEKNRFFPSYHKHAGKWKKRHGHKVRIFSKRDHANDCGVCHTDDACRKCHQLNRPKNHTGFWKMRGHGIKAVVKRETCMYCHNESFCVRCHKKTRPINHRGNWKNLHGKTIPGGHSGNTNRCTICHLPEPYCGVQCHAK